MTLVLAVKCLTRVLFLRIHFPKGKNTIGQEDGKKDCFISQFYFSFDCRFILAKFKHSLVSC